jgi:hypothetical protein
MRTLGRSSWSRESPRQRRVPGVDLHRVLEFPIPCRSTTSWDPKDTASIGQSCRNSQTTSWSWAVDAHRVRRPVSCGGWIANRLNKRLGRGSDPSEGDSYSLRSGATASGTQGGPTRGLCRATVMEATPRRPPPRARRTSRRPAQTSNTRSAAWGSVTHLTARGKPPTEHFLHAPLAKKSAHIRLVLFWIARARDISWALIRMPYSYPASVLASSVSGPGARPER